MKNTILVLTDFSDLARNAIYFALKAFPPDTYNYIMLHCYPHIHTTADVTISLSEKMRIESYQALDNEERRIGTELGIRFACEKIAYLGFLNEAVNYVAKERHPDLVVMGTKGETGLPAILLGSHASSLIKATHIPLLIVPEEAKFKGFKQLVLAADLATLSKPEHLEPLKEITDLFDSKLTILNVVKDGESGKEKHAAEAKALKEKFADEQVEFTYVHDSNTEHAIAQYVHDHPCDLLVVVERNRTFIVDLFHKSVSRNLALHGETPLLILHA